MQNCLINVINKGTSFSHYFCSVTNYQEKCMNSKEYKHQLTRRNALGLGLGTLGGALAPIAFGQNAWPSVKPITLVVGFPPGGQTDFAGRVVTAGLVAALGQALVIDNRPGANGNIATDYVAKGPADGYRLLIGNGSNMTLNPHTFRSSIVFDPTKLTPIGLLLQSSLVLAVPASLPVKDVKEFIAWIKAQDMGTSNGIDYASSGPGSVTQATMELFRGQIGKPKMNHIPYKGSGPAMIDLIAGRVSGMFDAASVLAPFVKSGQLRALMTTGTTRVSAFPNVPTAEEVGMKDLQVTAFIGLYGPPGLDPEITKKLNVGLNAALKDATVQKTITDRGDEPGGGSAEQLGSMTRNYFKIWGDVAKANDIRAE